MFKELGQFAGLMRQLPKIKEEMAKLQLRQSQITAEGDAGGGMVRVRMNGKMEMVACELSPEVLQLNDKDLLEDLIRAATNQAVQRVRQAMSDEMTKMAADMGLPPGMGIPGMES